MNVITGLPIGTMDPDATVYTRSPAMVPLPPATYPTSTAETIPSTGTLAEKTLEAGTNLIELICKSSASYGYFWRWHTATDTADCASSNAHGYLNPGDRIERGIPDGAVAIQAVGDGGDSAGVLIEYV